MKQWKSFTECWDGDFWEMTVPTEDTSCTITQLSEANSSSFSTRFQWESSREKYPRRRNPLLLKINPMSKKPKMAKKTMKAAKIPAQNRSLMLPQPKNQNNHKNSNLKRKPKNKEVLKLNLTSHKHWSQSSEWESSWIILIPWSSISSQMELSNLCMIPLQRVRTQFFRVSAVTLREMADQTIT